MKTYFLSVFFGFLLISCARVGSPNGGTKDTIPPTMLGSNIDTPRVNVPRNLKELRLDFDEYVMLKEASKNLIISPPIKKIKKMLPANLANKSVIIQWEDSLQANTTYNFNFGNSIRDNNEGNALPYFNFAFSTGEKIDDLYISGELKNIMSPPKSPTSNTGNLNEKNLVVGLYKLKDSMDFHQKPYYISKADADGYYELNYLSPANYKIIAFIDSNENSVFDSGAENVGFLKDSIQFQENISGLNLNLYPSKKAVKYLEMKENPGGILMLFQGNPDQTNVLSINENLKDYKITSRPKSDSVFIWFDAKKDSLGIGKSDNLKFSYDIGNKQDTVSVFYRMNAQNEMKISNEKGNLLPPKSKFEITSNYILDSINTEKWTLVSDSIAQPFTAKISEANPYKILVDSDFKEGKKYSLNIPKETAISFYDRISKSYRFDFEADKSENYGNLHLKIINIPDKKFWFQLLNEKEEPVYSAYTNQSEMVFEYLKPATYGVRILVDNNENGIWDAADFENQTFAEDVYNFNKKISARPLWSLNETWDLKEP
ncbi:MAG: Ig-like domain-containing protein [Flavobacteriaceae bacterium]|jgi:hypothetical protein|nr:Ig-like domain-containing protein [Flavobacteriaceae bacterium]